MTTQSTGVLLINLGTPDAPTKKSVRRYLKAFLSDPRVIDIHRVVRWLLLHLFILPTRPKLSAHAYQQIWTDEGSPLLLHSLAIKEKLATMLRENFTVSLGMRYGNPSIEKALTILIKNQCDKIIILPLFPQYSSAATGSALEKAMQLISRQKKIPFVTAISDFYNHPAFINAYYQLLTEQLEDFSFDLLLLSYHGLPTRQLGHCQTSSCLAGKPCPNINEQNQLCYRKQCYTTSQLLAEKLNLKESQYKTSFQSRLGRTPWIQPYTDQLLNELAKKGIKNLAIACPSFVTDCLETLEEINIRAKKQWQSLGGKEFKLVPCLNAHPKWIEALATIIKENS